MGSVQAPDYHFFSGQCCANILVFPITKQPHKAQVLKAVSWSHSMQTAYLDWACSVVAQNLVVIPGRYGG